LNKQERRNRSDKNDRPKPVLKLFAPNGRPYNVNQAKVMFKLNDEDDPDFVVLDVSVYRYSCHTIILPVCGFKKFLSNVYSILITLVSRIRRHLDTSYINVDVNPTYVRVTIKGKILQLTLPCEVSVERSNVRRNTTTGNLVINMARLTPCNCLTAIVKKDESTSKRKEKFNKRETKVITVRPPVTSRRALLEIGPPSDIHDFLKITEDPAKRVRKVIKEDEKDFENFQDNPDVPPLE